MSQLHNLQLDIMFLLYARAQAGGSPLSSQAIFASEQKSSNGNVGPVSLARIEVALSYLNSRNHVDTHVVAGEDAKPTFSISPKGLDWVEDWFSVEQEGTKCLFSPRRKGKIMVDLSYMEASKRDGIKPTERGGVSAHSWTKWGTIITGFGVLVSIILWKYS